VVIIITESILYKPSKSKITSMLNIKRNKTIYVNGVRVEFTLRGLRIWAKDREQSENIYNYLVKEGIIENEKSEISR
jgi:hypothetical protein